MAKEKSEEKKDTSLGKTAMLVGGAGVLALSALDGGVLTVIGSGVLAYGSYWLTDNTLKMSPEDVDSDRMNRDLGVARFVIAGACGLATFLNPFVGIPGTLLLLWARSCWRDELAQQVETTKEVIADAFRKQRKKKSEAKARRRSMGYGF